MLTKLSVNTPSTSSATVTIKDLGNDDGSLKLETPKGVYTCRFFAGLGGNIELRSALMSARVTIQDMGGLVCIGTATPLNAFSNTIANSTALLNSLQVGGDVSLLTKLAVNSPSVNTATVAIKGASGEDGTLILSSAKGINTSVFHNGSGGNIFLRSANSSGFISLNDTGSRVFIGTSTLYSAVFSNTIANASVF